MAFPFDSEKSTLSPSTSPELTVIGLNGSPAFFIDVVKTPEPRLNTPEDCSLECGLATIVPMLFGGQTLLVRSREMNVKPLQGQLVALLKTAKHQTSTLKSRGQVMIESI